MTSEYDRRQLARMLEHIASFRTRAVDLSGLISGLESLRYLLTAIPEAWLNRFWSAWGELEELYSIAVVREEPIEPLRTHPVIVRSIDEIEAMVRDLLGEEPSSG